jgi:hypothetical protein
MNRLLQSGLLLAAALPLIAAESPRGLRDPMQPPAVARAAAPASADTAAPVAVTARHLLVVDGRRYVVDGNRRRGVGDLLGDARIERIEDAAVVVRTATGTQRLPLFGGVVKQAALDSPTAPRTDRLSSSGGQP